MYLILCLAFFILCAWFLYGSSYNSIKNQEKILELTKVIIDRKEKGLTIYGQILDLCSLCDAVYLEHPGHVKRIAIVLDSYGIEVRNTGTQKHPCFIHNLATQGEKTQ